MIYKVKCNGMKTPDRFLRNNLFENEYRWAVYNFVIPM